MDKGRGLRMSGSYLEIMFLTSQKFTFSNGLSSDSKNVQWTKMTTQG